MRPVWLALGLLGIGLPLADAQERKFPYEAVVDVEEEFVRCGPGPKYYPTGKLRRGDRVTVHRHDPGGWAMIAPPADSFSWIQSEYVQKLASGRGSLTSNNVIVHVGSNLGAERSVYQRTLSKGDTVEILGEETFATDRGEARMYKIKPPLREYRWIAGKAIVAANGRAPGPAPAAPKGPDQPIPFIQGPIAKELETEVAAESDAFDPSPFGPAMTEGSPKTGAPLLNPTAEAVGVAEGRVSEPVEPGSLEDLRQQLATLDQQFRAMLQVEPQSWDLAALKAAYTALETAADHPAFTSHVQQRLATIQRYGKIQADYVDFYRLTSETQERDAKLMSLQKQNESKLKAAEAAPSSPQTGVPAPLTPSSNGTPIPANSAQPATNGGPQAAQPPKFSGAGIVQKSTIPAPGVPGYVLLSPDGRLLAYLEAAPGVDLSRAQNQALGIIGERAFRDNLKTDVIVVRGFQPVVLRTTLR